VRSDRDINLVNRRNGQNSIILVQILAQNVNVVTTQLAITIRRDGQRFHFWSYLGPRPSNCTWNAQQVE